MLRWILVLVCALLFGCSGGDFTTANASIAAEDDTGGDPQDTAAAAETAPSDTSGTTADDSSSADSGTAPIDAAPESSAPDTAIADTGCDASIAHYAGLGGATWKDCVPKTTCTTSQAMKACEATVAYRMKGAKCKTVGDLVCSYGGAAGTPDFCWSNKPYPESSTECLMCEAGAGGMCDPSSGLFSTGGWY